MKIKMTKAKKTALIINLSLLSLFLITLVLPAHASACDYNWETLSDPIGDYVGCVIGEAFKKVRAIVVAITIILTMFLIFKTVTSVGKPKILEELPQKWLYLILLVILVFGGGAIINITLKFFGFGNFATLVKPFDDFLNLLNKYSPQ